MTKAKYRKRMKQHEATLDKLWRKMVDDTNEFIEKNPTVSANGLGRFIEDIVDSLCLKGAWIQDRLNGKSGVYSSSKYRGSLTKKIRKALGYTY